MVQSLINYLSIVTIRVVASPFHTEYKGHCAAMYVDSPLLLPAHCWMCSDVDLVLG